MSEIDTKIFESAIRTQVSEIEEIYQKIAQRSKNFKKSFGKVESLSYQLHNLYFAFEDLFKLVADYFENNIETRDRWHVDLLKKMKIEIEGIRPALLSTETFENLNELRAFRHLFRHAYTYELDSDRVEMVFKKALKLHQLYQKDVERFLAAVRS